MAMAQRRCSTIGISYLEQENVMVFIEEPEAHLFPDGQKDVSDFIVMVRSMIGARFIITTHSPYILSSINNALYAYHLKTVSIHRNSIDTGKMRRSSLDPTFLLA
ncbi:AAA family ATPase [Aeromonas caviae]|uniref:AAA family ATPase n=1 Tax=Aeromonas caviae TaxID=648 RepID=UPI0039A61912